MNKKLLSIIMISTLIMFVGINVKAGCTSHTCNGTDSSGLSCSVRASSGKEGCEADSNCSWDCTGCSAGETLYQGQCSCPTPADFTASGCSGLYSTNGADGNGCQVSPTGDEYTYSSNNTKASVDEDGKVTVSAIDSQTCRSSFTITVTRTNACNNTKTATVSGEIMVPWGKTTKTECTTKPITQTQAEKNNWNKYHTSCSANASKCGTFSTKDENGKDVTVTGQECTVVSRGCGTKPPSPSPHCYDTGYGLLKWELKEKVVDNKIQDNKPAGWTIAKDANGNELTKAECYTKFKCATTYTKDRSTETTCNGTHEPTSEAGTKTNELSGTYLKKCGVLYGSTIGTKDENGNDKNLFFKISCTETMRTAFNGPIFNSDSSFLYPGTGFGFNYFANTKVACEGYWDKAFYSAAKSYINTYIKNQFNSQSFQGENINDEKTENFLNSATDALIGVENAYKNWKLDYYALGKPTGTIEDIQPEVSGVTQHDPRSFNLEYVELPIDGESSCGQAPADKSGDSKFDPFVYQELHNIQMKLPILSYDKNGATISEKYKVSTCDPKNDDNCLGRVFPISDIKEYAGQDYKYKVTINNLGFSHTWTNYETCDLSVKEKNVYFRSINVTDPFIQKINSDHKIGLNWKNGTFNFVDLIDANVWNKPSQYNQVRITEEDGQNIKNELKANKAYYVGICSTDSASTASTICGKYKQAVNGK